MMRMARLMLSAALLAAPLALAACDAGPPPRTDFPPLQFDYLTKLRLNVANIAIDNNWQVPADPREVGAYAPETPVAALRQMASDRLFAGGNSGRAVFTILDASLLHLPGRLDCNFAVRLAVTSADGGRSGYAEARVSRSLTLTDDDPATLRDALYTVVKQAMDDMNVEFEYQVRHSLPDWLQTTAGAAPLPSAVQSQDLAPPSGLSAAPGSRPPVTPLAPPRPPQPAPAPLPPGVQPLVQPMPLTPPPSPPPAGYAPVQSAPPQYAPPQYAPPQYSPPAYSPPAYAPPIYEPPVYSPTPDPAPSSLAPPPPSPNPGASDDPD